MSRRIYQAVLLTGLLTAGLAACTATGERATEIDQSIRQALEEAAARQPPGVDETRDLLLPPLTGGSVDAPPEERFHVTVESAPARQFLMSLVAETDINMVVHPDVEQTISLELRNVTVPEVLRIVREVYGWSSSAPKPATWFARHGWRLAFTKSATSTSTARAARVPESAPASRRKARRPCRTA